MCEAQENEVMSAKVVKLEVEGHTAGWCVVTDAGYVHSDLAVRGRTFTQDERSRYRPTGVFPTRRLARATRNRYLGA